MEKSTALPAQFSAQLALCPAGDFHDVVRGEGKAVLGFEREQVCAHPAPAARQTAGIQFRGNGQIAVSCRLQEFTWVVKRQSSARPQRRFPRSAACGSTSRDRVHWVDRRGRPRERQQFLKPIPAAWGRAVLEAPGQVGVFPQKAVNGSRFPVCRPPLQLRNSVFGGARRGRGAGLLGRQAKIHVDTSTKRRAHVFFHDENSRKEIGTHLKKKNTLRMDC